MEFLSKSVFFVLFGLAILLTIFYIANSLNCFMDPYKKSSEAVIMLIGACVVGVGLYLTYHQGYIQLNYVRGSIILVVAFLVSVVCVLIGLLFFNGPLHWQ